MLKEEFLDLPLAGSYLDDEGKKINEHSMQLLTMLIKRRYCALCLGAGVSIPAGLPSWAGLLNALMEGAILLNRSDMLDKDASRALPGLAELIEVIKGKSFFSPVGVLESAEYIQMFLDSQAVDAAMHKYTHHDKEQRGRRAGVYMAASVHAALERCQRQWMEPNKLTGYMNKPDYSLLLEVARMILCRHGIKHVITYNYDDLLEHAVEIIMNKPFSDPAVQKKCDSLVNEECVVQCGRGRPPAHIYHVHGRIRLSTANQPEQADFEKGIILSEESYQGLEQNVYNAINTCQSQLFQAYSCLFIGFSAQDYNYRRLIQHAPIPESRFKRIENLLYEGTPGSMDRFLKQELFPLPHFILYRLDDLLKDLVVKSEYHELMKNEETYKFILNSMVKLQRAYYQKYNIWPIYVKGGELLLRLQELAAAAETA